MSADGSPRPPSDDSAIGSSASSNLLKKQSETSVIHNYSRVRSNERQLIESNGSESSRSSGTTKDAHSTLRQPTDVPQTVTSDELGMSSKKMRYNNTTLLSRAIRTNLSCFDDLDTSKITYHTHYTVNYISHGINKQPHSIHRPISLHWPDCYDKMIDCVAQLDAMLINSDFRLKPVEWMLDRGLTTKPDCKICKNPMLLKYEGKTVTWRCNETQACESLYSPIRRPIFFDGHKDVPLIKLLYAIYHWSIGTQCDLLQPLMKIDQSRLNGIYESLMSVCRLSLEKSYPRFRLCNNPESHENSTNHQIKEAFELIDLISIKFNDCFIVCAKHPRSNCVRLGLFIPKVSKYSYADLTETWFASGANIRICENKFLHLTNHRKDLKIIMTQRSAMTTKQGSFDRDSAFGYIICQLSHVLKDFDSAQVTPEMLKLILCEMEWRELYGTNPVDSFNKIVEDIAKHGTSAHCYYQLSSAEKIDEFHEVCRRDDPEYVFAEKYFYANMQPLDADGKPICRFGGKSIYEDSPISIVQFACHFCSGFRFESFLFTMHLIAHAEKSRRVDRVKQYRATRHIECKHCFTKFKKEDIKDHRQIFHQALARTQFGCKICCIKFGDRSKYLSHMRQTHFEHEMPYRCPSCKYASSFQRETIIHFQEEHQQEYTIMCTYCFKSFTIPNPANLDVVLMKKVSQAIYNHISKHFALADAFKCDSCCLSFLSDKDRRRHKLRDHNPEEKIPEKEVRLQPFIVTASEEQYCTKSLFMELFIPNKRPNIMIDEITQASNSTSRLTANAEDHADARTSLVEIEDGDVSSDASDQAELRPANYEGDIIHVGPLSNAGRLLAGGRASLKVFKAGKHVPTTLTTEKIIESMSKQNRMDCVIPNQSVIVTPDGRPARCLECQDHVTTDHYVALLPCKPCRYETHCPRAFTRHQQLEHDKTCQ